MLLSISFHYDFYPLLIVAAIAWLMPILLSLFKLKKVPVVIAEILMGFLAGKFLLGGISEESYRILDFFALSGFLFLMFLGGLEIDVDQIMSSLPRRKITVSRYLKNPLLVGGTQFLLAIVLSYLASVFLAQFVDIPNTWYFSLIIKNIAFFLVVNFKPNLCIRE